MSAVLACWDQPSREDKHAFSYASEIQVKLERSKNNQHSSSNYDSKQLKQTVLKQCFSTLNEY